MSARRGRACFWPLGFLFVLAMALGIRLDACGRTGWTGLVLCLGAALVLGPLLGEGFFWLARLLCRPHRPVSLKSQKAFWLSLLALLLCWLPILLAFYPGITGYDVDNQLRQITTGQYNTQHPLLHTLLMGGCMKLLGTTHGYGLYTCIQTLLLALSIAYAMSRLVQLRIPRWLWICLLALFALAPQHGVMAVSGTKDVLFAAAMLALTAELLSPGKGKMGWLRSLLFAVLAGLMRNNAVYAFILLAFAGAIWGLRQKGWRFCMLMLCNVLVCFGGQKALQKAVRAERVSASEYLSLPCQQLARLYCSGELDEQVSQEIQSRVPYAADYVPWLADNAKSAVYIGDKPERVVSLLKLWGREGLKHPIPYIDAFLYTTKGFWDVTDISFATIYNYQNNGARGVMMMQSAGETDIQQQSLLPGLKVLWKKLFMDNAFLRLPLVWRVLHPAVYTWLLGFCMAFALWKQRWNLLAIGGTALAYLLTLLLGPCCIIRYQYDLMLIAPVLLGALSVPAKEEP